MKTDTQVRIRLEELTARAERYERIYHDLRAGYSPVQIGQRYGIRLTRTSAKHLSQTARTEAETLRWVLDN